MSHSEDEPLRRHRRALAWAVLLLALGAAAAAMVGRHPTELAPVTTLPAIGRADAAVERTVQDLRVVPFTWLAMALSVLGGGLVTIPLRIGAIAVLAVRRRWLRLTGFALAWLAAEASLLILKPWFHRGRPPEPLVDTVGFSFPSGHALGVATTTVALVLAFLPAGPRRRRWEWIAVAYAFTMSISRVYLGAHWFSDVVVGTLLGAGLAIALSAIAVEVRDLIFQAEHRPIPDDAEPETADV
ncbi:MAG TPA: phosphatase PAP2 family protein [Actinomycetota bacterium]|nr:phosphatase PAP2 family protein [Actinomycetota bacterium]